MALTEKGRQIVQVVSVGLSELHHSVLADLEATERKHFLATLQYLNKYHFSFYEP